MTPWPSEDRRIMRALPVEDQLTWQQDMCARRGGATGVVRELLKVSETGHRTSREDSAQIRRRHGARWCEAAGVTNRLSTMRIEWWILRVAASMCYIGHGAFGLLTKKEWVPFFGVAGIPRDAALALMPLIGAVDVALGIAVLWRPTRVLFV